MRSVIAVLLVATSAACISGDVDEERPTATLPADVLPEDSTFRYASRDDAKRLVLEVHISKIPLCDRTGVPDSHPFVELEIGVPPGDLLGPGSYRLEQDNHNRVFLRKTVGPECASSTATSASSGFIVLDEVSDDVVKGSFVGTNPDSQLDVRGSFVARHCGRITTCL